MDMNQLSLSKSSKPSQFNISVPVFVPPPQVYVPPEQQQGLIGLCVACNQFQNLATIHNPPFFEEPPSSELIIGKRKNRPAPPQRHDVVMRWKNYFGAGHLDDWQRLCSDLGLTGDLPSKNKCRQVCVQCPILIPALVLCHACACTGCWAWVVRF